MIPFNIFGHSNTAGEDNEPIVWVDSSDNSSYTLSGNDVTALFNKGSLGGAMTLNGSVKFANNGFESWSNSDYITRDLGEPFMTDNSFTIVTTFVNSDVNNKSYSGIWNGDAQNRLGTYILSNSLYIAGRANNAPFVPNALTPTLNNVITVIMSVDNDNNTYSMLREDGSNRDGVNIDFTNIGDDVVELLYFSGTATNAGANNPLHEFRLYDRAFTLTEMQTLQTELNNKYSKPIVWVDSSDATTYTLSGSDVLTLDNKGSLGGAMTLNGTVKFANSGFESWSNSDYITRDLGVNLMATSDFTMVVSFDLQDINSGSDSRFNIFSEVNYITGGSNYIQYSRYLSNMRKPLASSSVSGQVVSQSSYFLGLQTYICSYDFSNKILNFIDENGNLYSFNNFESTYGISNYNIVNLLANKGGVYNTGADNPLHEFRLYDRAFSLTEMQDLQTELNDKYTP